MASVMTPNPGSLVQIRNAIWKISGNKRTASGNIVSCRGISGLTKGKSARFVVELEQDFEVLDPASVELYEDPSNGFIDTKLYLEAAFRSAHPSTRTPLTLGKAAIDDLEFQHLPVQRALAQDRVRLLIADDVGLGKTMEAGLITSELILRGRADRILVVTTRSMLVQFQKEFWTRFSIPLSRLDSSAIRRMRNEIPAHYNVFGQFDRSIVSIDTLKKDSQIRRALEDSRWDLVIIDEAHNAAKRVKASGSESLRAQLARLLSRRADSLLLLTATPHDGSQESFASLIEMLDPTRVNAQSSAFTIHPNPIRAWNPKGLIKVLIPKTFRRHLLHRLYNIGIHRAVLFPDLDGVAKTLAWVYATNTDATTYPVNDSWHPK